MNFIVSYIHSNFFELNIFYLNLINTAKIMIGYLRLKFIILYSYFKLIIKKLLWSQHLKHKIIRKKVKNKKKSHQRLKRNKNPRSLINKRRSKKQRRILATSLGHFRPQIQNQNNCMITKTTKKSK